MDCREMFARLSDYLDGDISADLCEELRRHLDGCEPCVAFTETLKQTVDLCRSLPATPLPDEVRRELRALLRREDIRRRP